jgi:hypothetical protein
MNTTGFLGSTASNSVSYEMYQKGFFIAAFDLTTAQEGANDIYTVPTVKTGKLISEFCYASQKYFKLRAEQNRSTTTTVWYEEVPFDKTL